MFFNATLLRNTKTKEPFIWQIKHAFHNEKDIKVGL